MDAREREKDRRSANPAVSTFNALTPQFSPPPPNMGVTYSISDGDALVHAPSEGPTREENKEHGGFSNWENPSDRHSHRRDIRDRDDGQQDLPRMIGYLTTASLDDWAVVLDVCERASATKANAKEAARALRREIKYCEAPQQLSAARLWAIMLRNSSELFVHQCAKSKFLDSLEGVLESQRTSPAARERLLDVLAAATYASSGTSGEKESTFRVLWRKVKLPGKPDEGMPFDPDDAMFNPPSPRRGTAVNLTPTLTYPPVHPQSLQPAAPPNTLTQSQPQQPQPQTQAQSQTTPQPPPRVNREAPGHDQLQRVIPPEEDLRRQLFQECGLALGGAQLLSEALLSASPEDPRAKDIIKEWYSKCLSSQELIAANIPWAEDRSRAAREAQQQRSNGQGAHSVLSKPHHDRNMQGSGDESPVELLLTPEGQLLCALIQAQQALSLALRAYNDVEVERTGIEPETMECSQQETPPDRSKKVISKLCPCL